MIAWGELRLDAAAPNSSRPDQAADVGERGSPIGIFAFAPNAIP